MSNDRMHVGQLWESQLAEHLRATGWEVAPFGQALLPDGARAIIGHPCRTLWRWIPDLVGRHGEVRVLIEAKSSSAAQTGNHAIENDSTRAGEWVDGAGIPVVYAFPHALVDEQGTVRLAPGYCTVGTWLARREPRGYQGHGSGTPFHVAACRDVCSPSITAALDADPAVSA